MNNTALITGASSGIGAELARIHASHKGNLILVARRVDFLENLRKEIISAHNVKVEIIALDLSLPGASLNLYQQIQEKGLQVDILINNAGFGDYGAFHETSMEKESMMLDLNIKALTELTKYFGKEMGKRGHGYIMNVASLAAFMPGPLMSVYYATKHYVLAFSEGIASEWAPLGVKVTALCPGPTASGFADAANLGGSKLFQRFPIPSSAQVAAYGYKAMLRGKRVAVHGFINKLMVFSMRFTPRNLAAAMVKKVQGMK